MDRFVRGDIDIRRVRVERQFILLRRPIEIARLSVPRHVNRALRLCFVVGLLAPRAVDDVIGRLAGAAQQVHGHHGELQQGPALQEQHAVVRRYAQQRAEIGLGLIDDFVEGLRAMADLQDRHARAGQGQQVALRLFDGRQGKHGRARRKIIDALFHGFHPVGRGLCRGNVMPISVPPASRVSSRAGQPSQFVANPEGGPEMRCNSRESTAPGACGMPRICREPLAPGYVCGATPRTTSYWPRVRPAR